MHTLKKLRFTIKSLLILLGLMWLTFTTVCWAQVASPPTVSTQQNQYVLADGVKLNYVDSGSGAPVVLLHGNDGSLQDFTMSIFDHLACKYRTLAFDRPGHGKSDSPVSTVATPEIQARIIHQALHQLGVERPLLVAHSWSSSIALSYCLQFPNDLCGVVLLAGVAYETEEGAPNPIYRTVDVPILGTAVALLFKATGRHSIEQQLKQAFAPDTGSKQYQDKFLASMFRISQIKAAARDELTLNLALRRMSPFYKTIKLPVVIVTGDSDRTVAPDKHSYPLHTDIAQSQLIVIRNAGHELQFTRPQEVLAAIDQAMKAAATLTKSGSSIGDAEHLVETNSSKLCRNIASFIPESSPIPQEQKNN